MSTPTTLDDYAARILRVLEHVQTHLDEAMTPSTLAEVACFSPFHFQRIFRAMVGESVMGHIRRLRLERAAWKLKFTDEPVSRIAFETGYEAHEAFTRAFGARFDGSPSSFRRKHRRVEYPAAPSEVHFDAEGAVRGFRPLPLTVAGMRVEVCTRPAQTVAFVRHHGRYDEVGGAWDELMGWVASEGYFGPGMEMLGLCYDDPEITSADQIRYDACVTLDADFETRGAVGRRMIAGGEFAAVRHTGPYSALGETYEQLIGHWLPASGREPAEPPCIEQYWNNPEDTPPEELETDIYLRLRS